MATYPGTEITQESVQQKQIYSLGMIMKSVIVLKNRYNVFYETIATTERTLKLPVQLYLSKV